MSLLGRKAPHVVYVQKRKMVRTERGGRDYELDGTPIPVRCMVEPVRDWSSSEEVESLGLQVVDLAIVRARKWPGDINSYVTFEGAEYETVGAPQSHSVSPRTGHHRVTIKWLRDL
ncbi:hypothetical protein [Microbacterium sp. NPDC089696]|uniref:hypothetical protein n=1 Tax=Microbacterium sp. NPDC089696 TaxID=3364199 RepID=UPI0038097692